MTPRRHAILMAVFYPFTMVAIASGIIAFIMLVLKIPLQIVSAVVLGFYAASIICLYLIFRPVVRDLEIRRPLLAFILTMSAFAILSIILLIWEWLAGGLRGI